MHPSTAAGLAGGYGIRPYDCYKAAKEEAHHDIFR